MVKPLQKNVPVPLESGQDLGFGVQRATRGGAYVLSANDEGCLPDLNYLFDTLYMRTRLYPYKSVFRKGYRLFNSG